RTSTRPARFRTLWGGSRGESTIPILIPSACAQHDAHDGKHDRDLDQHTDDGRERGARLEAKKRDRSGDGELEEIRGADQGRRAGDIVRDAEGPVEPVGNAGVEIHLNHDRDGEQRDNERLPYDLLALKPE